MSQISRPFQIGLALVSVLGIAWFLVLRPHHAGAPAAPAQSASQPGPQLPGMPGLERAIGRARGAVAQSKQEAQRFSNEFAAARSPASGRSAAATAGATASKARLAAKLAHPQPAPVHAAVQDPAVQVADQLAAGDVVVLLFWNPDSVADQQVHAEVEQAAHAFRHVDVHVALPSQVTQYGTVTQEVTVLDTPTIEVIAPSGAVTTLGAPTDTTIVGQAIEQARDGFQPVPARTFASPAPGSERSKFLAAANRVCRQSFAREGIHNGVIPATQSDSRALEVHASVLRSIERLALPAADRQYVLGELAASEQAAQMILTSGKTRSAPAAIGQLEDAEARSDAANTALVAYGLGDCFPLYADQPGPAV